MPITTEGLDEHEDELDENSERAKKLKEFTFKAAIVLTTNFWPRRWRRQVDLLGKPWPALDDKTKRRKKSARILFDRGILQKSVQIGALGSLTKADEESFTIGTADIRAATHNFGDATRGIPKRTWIGFDRKDLKFLDKGLAEFILKGKTP